MCQGQIKAPSYSGTKILGVPPSQSGYSPFCQGEATRSVKACALMKMAEDGRVPTPKAFDNICPPGTVPAKTIRPVADTPSA